MPSQPTKEVKTNGEKRKKNNNNNNNNDNKSGNNNNKKGLEWKKAMEDPRFSKALTDPRLKPMKDKQNKLKVDDRFKEIFQNQNFQVYGSKDIRGKKVGFTKKDPLERFYQKNEDDEDESEEDENEEENDKVAEDESEEEESEEEEFNVEDEEDDFEDTDNEDLLVEIGDATRRIAIQNLDWTYIKAVDIFVLCQSFVPSGGAIKSVTVYPSDFGLEKMKEDEELGPSVFREGEEKESESDEDEIEEVDTRKLRKYELNKLKYYYAVVECDGVETAQSIYNNADGMEIEKTANVIDMRYIPDEASFEGRTIRESADRIPTNYKPPDYQTKALQHTDFDCTWDEVDVKGRNEVLRRPVKKSELNQIDYSAYLAPASDEEESSDDEDDGQALNPQKKERLEKKEKELKSKLYKNILNSIENEGENEEEDMEIEFTSGLTENVEKLIKKKKTEKDREDETVFEASLRKKKEKKREAKKNQKSEEDDNSGEEGENDLPLDSFERMHALEAKQEAKFLRGLDGKEGKNVSKKNQKSSLDNQQGDEEKRKRDELELMTIPDMPSEEKKAKKGYNLKTLITEHSGSKRQKRKLAEKGHQADDFKVDLEDERFKAVLEDPQFTLDPTSKEFVFSLVCYLSLILLFVQLQEH
eukprot:TRINITY_DN2284_c0_g1_i4.p1 TRINITY_DN2284_c0_g1~~TRINITY_DN2284_c0_g1_i4.p1  ORF type:complete len:681 (-),score=260.41 TRINITY_DN2284_c0_g1_i4:342-2270(-)